MSDRNFIDEARIYLKAGDGGNGCASFRREKYVSHGGPDGGHGGNGADIVFYASHQYSTLKDFKYQQHYRAPSGRPGASKGMTGRSGEAMRVGVPLGTLIYSLTEDGEKECLVDLKSENEEFLAAQGGRGGRGNTAFVNSINQAPKEAEDGKPGEERTVFLELKILADVALVGFPNAGKSTLISSISHAKPKVGAYPFTTLSPSLGVVEVGGGKDAQSFVVADIPGLIEGAHEGKGLGIRFLKHLERSFLLWFVIDCNEASEHEPLQAFHTLSKELSAYDAALAERPKMVLLNKMDTEPASEHYQDLLDFLEQEKIHHFSTSGASRQGLEDLKNKTFQRLQAQKSVDL